MRKFDVGSSLFLMLLGLIICWQSVRLGLGTWRAPGPGFLPFCAGCLLFLLAAAILAGAALKGEKERVPAKFWIRPGSQRVVLSILISVVLYNILWTRLGFVLTTLLFMGFLLRGVGKRKWWVVLTGTGLTSFVAYFLFQRVLKCQLPTGFLGF